MNYKTLTITAIIALSLLGFIVIAKALSRYKAQTSSTGRVVSNDARSNIVSNDTLSNFSDSSKKSFDKTPSSNNILRIGMAAGYAPFVSVNEQGEYEGFDIDLSRALAQKLNRNLELKDLGSMNSLFIALDQGSIDAIIWGLSITQDRLKKVAMVRYQGKTVTSFPLLFWKKIPQGFNSLDAMKGKIIAVEPGSSQEALLDLYPAINKQLTEKVDDALLMIQFGKADAALVEHAIANKFKRKFSEIVSIDVSN